MGFLSRKTGNLRGSVTAPSYDPYNRWLNTGNSALGFRADKHVIMPGVTSYEEMRLKGVRDYVAEQTGKECTLSQELINDMYSLYVNENVKRRPTNSTNAIRHKVLDKVYDSLTKVVTVDSPLFTQILSRELAMALQVVDDEVRKEQKNQSGGEDGEGDSDGDGLESSTDEGNGDGEGDSDSSQESKQGGKGDSSGNRKSIEDIVDDALKKAEKSIEEAKDNADEKIKDLEEKLGKEAMKDLMDNDPEFLEKIDELKDRLSSVSINKSSIQKVMEKILNESMNYFSTKFKRVEESLFDCEECEDLFGLEFLHPIFKNSELMNVGNESRVYKGKMDLYLDCSGSMGSMERFEGTDIRMIDLAKGIAMVLYRMGMIDNLYFFDNHLYKIDNINEISILSFSKSGGTNFNKVIDMVNTNGNNSVVITDGFDNCEKYSKQAFWIGIGGTTFKPYESDSAFTSYRGNKQCVAYNSNTSKFDYCVD
jgi:vacuolar-type H+-ATPase subunit H